MGQQKTTVSQSGDDATRNSSHTPSKKRTRLVLLQLLAGHLLIWGGAAVLVLGLSGAKGLLATVMFLLGGMLALVGTTVAILAYAQAIFGAIASAIEEVVARMQEKQPPTPSSTP